MKKHKILFKIFFWILIIVSIIAISYILLDYKSQSYDLASVYNSVGTERQNDTNSMKKLDFIYEYTRLTGNLDLAINKGLAIDGTANEDSDDDDSGSGESDYTIESEGSFEESLVDPASGFEYSVWHPVNNKDKPIIICFHGMDPWTSEKAGFGVYHGLKNGKLKFNATIVVPHKSVSGSWVNEGIAKIDSFIDSMIYTYNADQNAVLYYGFSQGAIDFKSIGPLYSWCGAALNDGGHYLNGVGKATCPTLKCYTVVESSAYGGRSAKSYHDAYAKDLGLDDNHYYYEYFSKSVNYIHMDINSAFVARNVSDLPFVSNYGILYRGNTDERVALDCFAWLLKRCGKESTSGGGGGGSGGSDTSSDDAYIASIKVSDSDQAIIDKDIVDAIHLVTNGTKYNSMADFKNFSKVESDLKDLQKNYAETITVKCWQWSSKSGSSTNYDKTTKNVNITCNKAIAPIMKSIFNDIYNLPSKPVIYSSGCWVVRKMTSSDSASAHSFGCAIDLNASSCLSSGATYGNGYRQTVPTKAQWESLPDCQTKYEIFYEGCPVVKVFYKYGFYWGGEWKSSADGMHFGFIGDCGNDGRKNGQRNQKK